MDFSLFKETKSYLNTKKVDEKAEELTKEFKEHLDKCQAAYPQMTDIHLIFEGWAIQKLAGIQLILLALAEDSQILRTIISDPSLLRSGQRDAQSLRKYLSQEE